jgi:hypothetical protein
MTDFTKEELQIIHLDMTVYINRTPMLAESPSHRALRDKVEAMIDNYCEHEKCPNPSCNISKHPANVECMKLEEINDNQ